ncbi:Dsl1p PWA37_002889 [Arxiozyma heterogenica]|uniref:Dsl1p n=1 Tax=Arxiozyma heterogenica TaxID=278026 RepID=UPI002EFFF1E0
MLLSLGLDTQTILELISKDPLLCTASTQNEKNNNSNNDDNYTGSSKVDDLIKENTNLLNQDNELTIKLDDLNKLKTFRDLIMEFNANLELFEFENCYYSLKTLRNKLKSYKTILSRQSYSFQRSIMKYIDMMHLRLIENIYKLLFEKFWVIDIKDCKSIIFNSEILIDSSEKMEYNTFISMINQLFFINNLENEWFLKDMGICSESEEVRKMLTNIDLNFIKCNNLVNLIKKNIFNSNIKFEYNMGTDAKATNNDNDNNNSSSSSNNKLSFIRITTKEWDEENLEIVLHSIKSLVDFLQALKTSQYNTIIIKDIGEVIIKELIKFVKSNAASILFNESNSLYLDEIKSINDGLIQLTADGPNFNFDGSEIINLIEDKDLYYKILIDQNFNESINVFKKKLKLNQNWIEIKDVIQLDKLEGNTHNNKGEVMGTQEKLEKAIDPVDEPNVDSIDNDDDIEDAWNTEIDINIDDLDNDIKEPLDREEKNEDENAWDAEWDIGNEDEDEINFQNKDQGTIKVTKINEFIIESNQLFEKKCHELVDIQRDYYLHKLQMLQNAIFVMIQSSYSESEWWQLYIDCKYTSIKELKLTYISSLSDEYLTTLLIKHKLHIKKAINNQLSELEKHEENPSWSSLIDDLLPYTKGQLLEPLSNLKSFSIEYENTILDIMDYIYNKSIIDIVLRWDIISEKNSENLSELMTLIHNNIYIDYFEKGLQTLSPASSPTRNLIKYKEIRDRFKLISKFLPLHLKDIMEMFYNGEFYLFSTEEIVAWITLLFADTPLRKDAISEIYEIREAANED